MMPPGISNAWVKRNAPRVLSIGCAILAAAWPGAARAIVTSDGVGTHVVTPGVPAFGVNLDGVVFIGSEAFPGLGGGTGALISDTHILTAAHNIVSTQRPALNPFVTSVRFDLPGGPVWIPVKGYAVHPDYDPINSGLNSDVAVLELASPAPAGVPRYELYTANDEIGKAFVVAGYGRTGSGETGATFFDGNKRAGRNRFEMTGTAILALNPPDPGTFIPDAIYYDFDSGQAANDLTPLVTGSPDLGFGADEVNTAPGDSGGPAFIEGGDGIFRIAGITSFGSSIIGPSGGDYLAGINASWGEFSGSARVSDSLAFINGAMAGNLRRQRIFNDGLTHVINDGLDSGSVVVANSPAPADAATTVTLANAVIRGLDTEAGGLGVTGSSLVEMEAGLIEGAPAARVQEGGRFHISGGTLNAVPNPPGGFIDDSWAVFANENSEVRLSGGTLTGINKGIFAVGDSQVFINAGSVTGQAEALYIGGMAEIDGGSFSSPGEGLRAVDSGSLTIRGGTFHGGANGGRSGNTSTVAISDGTFTGGSVGFLASDSSGVEITGGTFSAPFAFFANAQAKVRVGAGTFTGTNDGFQSTDATEVLIDGGTFNGTIVGLRALGSSLVTVNGGSFSGSVDGLLADTDADLRIHGGTFTGTNGLRGLGAAFVEITGGEFTGSNEGLLVTGSAHAVVRGGTFTGDAEDGLYASGTATVAIFGGSFTGGYADVFLDESAVVRIHGYGFNRPVGPVADESGTISGFYFDGTPFSMFFERFDDSVIELVFGYDGWAAFHGLDGANALFAADPNGNGIPNVLELVFGGNPAAGAVPTGIANILIREDAGDGEQDYFKLTHPVTQLSVDFGAESFIEYGTDLASASWAKAIHGTGGVIITTTPDGFSPGVHRVEVRIPKALAPNGRLFARIGGGSL